MLHCVALVRPNVSEECIASSTHTSVLTSAMWRNIPEDGILRSHHRGTLESYTNYTSYFNPEDTGSIRLKNDGNIANILKH
jgi:hypothetical protein